MSKYTIGIDLGGTTMTAGLVNEKFEVVGKVTWATRLPRPAQDLEKALAELCRTVARENKVDFADIRYVGIGTPGSVNFTTGFVGFNTNFGYYDWNLGPDMEKLLGCKVYVENDANAAAFGEYIAGGAKGYRDAVIITLGTGIGSGIILNGKILRGFNFAAGEMGHNVIVKDGIQCTCGRKGCWERYASATALIGQTKAAMEAHPESLPKARRFAEYYIPTTLKLLHTYNDVQGQQGENAETIRRDIAGILHTLNQAYSNLYDNLLSDVAMDVSSEIAALEGMLANDGLTGRDFQ